MDEDALLQRALAMSMGANQSDQPGKEVETSGGDTSMFDAYDEELQNAIKMSMAEVQPGEEIAQASGTEAVRERERASKLAVQQCLGSHSQSEGVAIQFVVDWHRLFTSSSS